MIKLICLVFIVSAIIFQGCGSVSVPSNFVVSETRRLSVVATDGVLKGVNVRLASVLEGSISKAVQTDEFGRATIVVSVDVINQLKDHDLTYLYVESVFGSSVLTNSLPNSEKGLKVGQVKLKSYVGTAAKLKSKAAQHEQLDDDPELRRSAVVSHFSNSVALMLEAEMKRDGLISSVISPETVKPDFPVTNLIEAESQRLLLQDAQTDRDSSLGKKLKLIAIATKGLIEQDISNFLDDGKNNELKDGSEALLDLAVNSTIELNSVFISKINQLSAAVEDDLENNNDIRAGMEDPEAVFKAMDFLSTSDVIKATSVTNIFLDISVSQSLSSSTPYTYVKKVEDTTRELRGGEFIGNSFAPSSEGSFVYHP